MTQTEALKSAIEFAEYCLEELDLSYMASNQAKRLVEKAKEALAQPEQERCVGCEACIDTACGRDECPNGWTKAPQPEQETVAWKLVPTEPTDEMLKAMDECSTEGYDERLYAGHAASVYMAAVDVAPTPPQPEQEPVAWGFQNSAITGSNRWMMLREEIPANDQYGGALWTPLYTTPPQRKPLTDEELRVIENKINPTMRWRSSDEEGITLYPQEYYELVRAIEAAHGIKD